MRWADVLYSWIQQSLLRRYLLGRVGRGVRNVVERGYFQSARACERLMLAEEDLVISYVQGHLSRKDVTCFEEHYLTSAERRSKVELARFLSEQSDEAPIAVGPGRGFRVRFMVAAIMALIVVVGPLLYWGSHRTQIVPLEWSPAVRGTSPGSGVVPFQIVKWRSTVRFEFEPTDATADSYVARLSHTGTEVANATLKPNRQRRLELDVPVSKLSTGIFDLSVQPRTSNGRSAESDRFRFEIRMP